MCVCVGGGCENRYVDITPNNNIARFHKQQSQAPININSTTIPRYMNIESTRYFVVRSALTRVGGEEADVLVALIGLVRGHLPVRAL